MADMKIDAGRATPWVKNVREEINSVNKTLTEVRQVCATFPGEGDTVFQLIESTGNMLEDTWNAMTSAYQSAWEKVENGINALVQAGSDVAEFVEDFVAKIK